MKLLLLLLLTPIYGYKLPNLPPKITPLQKTNEFIKLTRIDNNFIPITILSGLSGIITNPTTDWRTWILSSPFITAFSMVQLLCAASMVMNDLYDIENDKINNPNRPLVKRTIYAVEAKTLTMLLTIIYIYLGMELPLELNIISKISLIILTLYTPILKRMILIKNLVCSTIISLSVPFIGLTTTIGTGYHDIPIWTRITAEFVFITSIFIEIMLDIGDMKGDKESNIFTIPVLFGRDKTLSMLSKFIFINICYFINEAHTVKMLTNILIVYLPQIYSINKLLMNNEEDEKGIIKDSIKYTTISMIVYFINMIL